MNIEFLDYVMVCNSTGVQTVNLIPAIQFSVKNIVILSTPLTEKQGLTERFIKVAGSRNIKCEKLLITENEEKNFSKLSSKLFDICKSYPKILWNISGGQKIPSSALLLAFQKRIESDFKEDKVLYVEATPPEIWYIDSQYNRFWVKTSAPISLKELLYLFNYETLNDEERIYPDPRADVKEKIDIGRKALKYFKNNEIFREAFFNYMKSPESSIRTREDLREAIRKALNELKPELRAIRIRRTGYEDLELKIKHLISSLDENRDIESLRRHIAPLKLIQRPDEIYEDYWNSIKLAVIDRIIKSIEFEEIKLVNTELTGQKKKELMEQIKDLGGDITSSGELLFKKDVKSFSAFRSNGILFEWMVAAAIYDEIQSDSDLKECVTEIYHGVKTKRLNSPDRHDAEHDIVIVTSFGTLIIIELKTYEFSGDLAQAQEALAYKKSGPYGKALIIGPVMREMVRINQKGIKEFPGYINGPLRTQEDTARQNDIKYYYLDQINAMLKERLFIQKE